MPPVLAPGPPTIESPPETDQALEFEERIEEGESGDTRLSVKNATKYAVVLKLSGPMDVVQPIAPTKTWSRQMRPGTYKVDARAFRSNVRPLATEWTLIRGRHHRIWLVVRRGRPDR